jgi:hypothetical protein
MDQPILTIPIPFVLIYLLSNKFASGSFCPVKVAVARPLGSIRRGGGRGSFLLFPFTSFPAGEASSRSRNKKQQNSSRRGNSRRGQRNQPQLTPILPGWLTFLFPHSTSLLRACNASHPQLKSINKKQAQKKQSRQANEWMVLLGVAARLISRNFPFP